MTQPDPTPDYPHDVPPEVLATADHAVLRFHEMLDGAPLALVVTAYRAGARDSAQLAAALAEALTQRNALVTTLNDVLRNFHEKGHPGRPCVRTGWVTEETFQQWHATLRSLPAIDTDALARIVTEAAK